VADALNNTASFGYSYGDLATITDPLNNTVHRNSDGAGRLVSQIDPLGNLTQCSWDPLDQLIQITDANNGLTKFTRRIYGDDRWT
jgi:YD repeat-containing protein